MYWSMLSAGFIGKTFEGNSSIDSTKSRTNGACIGPFLAVVPGIKILSKNPSESQKKAIEDEFDTLFKTKTMCDVFNRALSLIYDKKAELLKVLARPEMPLHNNGSEQEIREYVTRRKVSGGTRSDAGKQCRDTFTSLKKTCHKLSVSFWEYLRGTARSNNFNC